MCAPEWADLGVSATLISWPGAALSTWGVSAASFRSDTPCSWRSLGTSQGSHSVYPTSPFQFSSLIEIFTWLISLSHYPSFLCALLPLLTQLGLRGPSPRRPPLQTPSTLLAPSHSEMLLWWSRPQEMPLSHSPLLNRHSFC